MCFSAPVSFSAYAVAMLIAVVLAWRRRSNDLWNAGFIATFALIQLIEGFIWLQRGNGSDAGCTSHALTKLLAIALILQPVVQSAGGFFTNFFVYKNVPIWRKTITVLQVLLYGGLAVAVISKTLGTQTDQYCTQVGPKGHFVWVREGGAGIFGFKSMTVPLIYLTGLLLPLLFMRPLMDGLILLAIGVATLVLSLIFYRKEVSSIWCFSAIIYAVSALCLSYAKQCELRC